MFAEETNTMTPELRQEIEDYLARFGKTYEPPPLKTVQ